MKDKDIKPVAKYIGIKESNLILLFLSFTVGYYIAYFLYFAIYGLTHETAYFAPFPRPIPHILKYEENFSGPTLKYVASIQLVFYTIIIGVLSYFMTKRYSRNSDSRIFLYIKYIFLITFSSGLIFMPILYVLSQSTNPW